MILPQRKESGIPYMESPPICGNIMNQYVQFDCINPLNTGGLIQLDSSIYSVRKPWVVPRKPLN